VPGRASGTIGPTRPGCSSRERGEKARPKPRKLSVKSTELVIDSTRLVFEATELFIASRGCLIEWTEMFSAVRRSFFDVTETFAGLTASFAGARESISVPVATPGGLAGSLVDVITSSVESITSLVASRTSAVTSKASLVESGVSSVDSKTSLVGSRASPVTKQSGRVAPTPKVTGGTHVRINAAVAVLLLPLACEPAASPEASKPSAPVAVFPRPQDLAALPSLPAPAEAFGIGSVPVDSWSSLAAPAAQDDPSGYEDGSPWGGFARTLAAAHADRLRLSPALRCAAAEIARFQLEKGGLPNESLRRFLAARCGSTSPDPLPVVSTLDAPEAATDQAIFEHTQAAVRDMLEKELGAGHHGIGVAAVRKGRRVAIAAVLGLDEVRFDTLSRTVDASRRTVVRGTMLAPAGQALAIINRGDYATALCEPDLALKLPDFAFACELGPGDHAAWLQIMVRQEGRAMSTSVADLLVCDGDPATLEYRPRVVGPPSPVADGAALSAALVEGVNRVRREARFPTLSVAPGQSTENARLAGTLIDASVGRRTQDADVIALGLIAGWNVDGIDRKSVV
jgi:hypothetical protein